MRGLLTIRSHETIDLKGFSFVFYKQSINKGEYLSLSLTKIPHEFSRVKECEN